MASLTLSVRMLTEVTIFIFKFNKYNLCQYYKILDNFIIFLIYNIFFIGWVAHVFWITKVKVFF
jgi:hypothetical protein